MKNYLLSVSLVLYVAYSFGQWTTQNVLTNGRNDDIFFINDSVGWVAGGNSTKIFKTIDGGINWIEQFHSGKYLRSIEFATPSLGFCGSLDSSFYRTVDGGNTWTDIAEQISPKPPGICGLSAPTADVIYGCGIWSSPAYVIKSQDGGITWTTIDLSSFATALVEIHFEDELRGFVTGKANPESDGGIILYTSDGGISWEVKHKTMFANDYIWKIQSPDNQNYYCSVQAMPLAENVRMLKSVDGGESWITEVVNDSYSYVQVIGFIDTQHGWTGGLDVLYETTDGGLSWEVIPMGYAYNRFLKISDTVAFMTGLYIYKYESGQLGGLNNNETFQDEHELKVWPNPANDIITVELTTQNRTICKLQLYSSNGQLLHTFYDGLIDEGLTNFTLKIDDLPSQTLFLILKSNESMVYKKIIIER